MNTSVVVTGSEARPSHKTHADLRYSRSSDDEDEDLVDVNDLRLRQKVHVPPCHSDSGKASDLTQHSQQITQDDLDEYDQWV